MGYENYDPKSETETSDKWLVSLDIVTQHCLRRNYHACRGYSERPRKTKGPIQTGWEKISRELGENDRVYLRCIYILPRIVLENTALHRTCARREAREQMYATRVNFSNWKCLERCTCGRAKQALSSSHYSFTPSRFVFTRTETRQSGSLSSSVNGRA